jgi:hypothetical protein
VRERGGTFEFDAFWSVPRTTVPCARASPAVLALCTRDHAGQPQGALRTVDQPAGAYGAAAVPHAVTACYVLIRRSFVFPLPSAALVP